MITPATLARFAKWPLTKRAPWWPATPPTDPAAFYRIQLAAGYLALDAKGKPRICDFAVGAAVLPGGPELDLLREAGCRLGLAGRLPASAAEISRTGHCQGPECRRHEHGGCPCECMGCQHGARWERGEIPIRRIPSQGRRGDSCAKSSIIAGAA